MSSIKKNVIWVIFLSIFLKGIGFLNRIVIAAYFGATVNTDAYYVATGLIEGILSIVLASASVCLIQIYISASKEEKKKAISFYLELFLVVLLLAMAAMILFSDPVAHALAPDWESEQRQVSQYLKLASAALPFMGVVMILGAALQGENSFTPIKLTGTVSSLVSIVSVVLLQGRMGIDVLLFAYVLSYVLNALMIFACARKYIKICLVSLKNQKLLLDLLKLMAPLVIGNAAHELNLLIDKVVGTKIASGAITSLSYATTLYLFIEGILIQSYVMVLYPDFTMCVKQDRKDTLISHIKESVTVLISLLAPITVISIFHARDIVGLLFARGAFGEDALEMTSAALVGYCIGFLPLALRDIQIKLCYSYKNTKDPMLIGIAAVLLNIVLDYAIGLNFGIIGLTLSTAIANLFSVACLAFPLKKYGLGTLRYMERRSMAFLVFANALCLAALLAMDRLGVPFLISIALSLLLYAMLLYALDFEKVRTNGWRGPKRTSLQLAGKKK